MRNNYMFITVLKSKIHIPKITDANIGYEGSISIDPHILYLADINEYEQVHVYNVSNGERVITYAIKGKEGDFCVNGAAAHKVNIGDTIIICAYGSIDSRDTQWIKPKTVYMEKEIK